MRATPEALIDAAGAEREEAKSFSMDFTPEDRLFRQQARDWLSCNVPREKRPAADPVAQKHFDLAWQRAQFDGGWAGVAWPKEYGGLGLSMARQLIWCEEYARARAPSTFDCCYIGLAHGGPTLAAFGTDEQKRGHLLPILRGEVTWCQGFSEPGAGSDLAALRTSAVIDGDDLVVSGQKIWTSWGHQADYQELLVRTDPESKRHQGISWVICDMSLPGVEVRPIPSMTGEAHNAECFYDEVRIPLDNVVGGLNNGWKVAMATLGFERGTANVAHQNALVVFVEDLIDYACNTKHWAQPGTLIADDEFANRLANARADVAAMRGMIYLMMLRAGNGEAPGPESSFVRLYHTELLQKVHRLAIDLLGPSALDRRTDLHWSQEYLFSFAETIAGGTAQVQRNLIAERVLGLPRS